MPSSLSPAIVARFRNVALERIENVEAAWVVLSREGHMPDTEAAMLRELHTLKGEAGVVGFVDAATLCQSIENIFSVASARRFAITDDMDILTTMALQFLRIVVRRKDEGPVDGIDLPRFLRQIDDLVAEEKKGRTSRKPSEAARAASGVPRNSQSAQEALSAVSSEAGRLSASTRRRLARRILAAYVESAMSGTTARAEETWRALALEWAGIESTALDSLVTPHLSAARETAERSGKQIETSTSGLDVRVGVDIAEAITTFVLHAVRNAVAHGIESPAERERTGKPAVGSLRIRASLVRESLELEISDDGSGVAVDAVRSRAAELGLLSSAAPTEAEILQVLFQPGFSTANEVTDLAGRGVGLDAVEARVKEVGGKITVQSTRGEGARFRVRLPCPTYAIPVHLLAGPSADITFAVPATWSVDALGPAWSDALDPLALCGVPCASPAASAIGVQVRRGDTTVRLLAREQPRPADALRLLVTRSDEPELVLIDERLAILVRPENALRPSRLP